MIQYLYKWISYQISGNFCAMKLLYDNFFIGMTPYHVNTNSAHAFHKINFVAAINYYQNIFYNENFQIYGTCI